MFQNAFYQNYCGTMKNFSKLIIGGQYVTKSISTCTTRNWYYIQLWDMKKQVMIQYGKKNPLVVKILGQYLMLSRAIFKCQSAPVKNLRNRPHICSRPFPKHHRVPYTSSFPHHPHPISFWRRSVESLNQRSTPSLLKKKGAVHIVRHAPKEGGSYCMTLDGEGGGIRDRCSKSQ